MIPANCIDGESGLDEGRCEEKEHFHCPIYCMWHGQTPDEHAVGAMCINCDRQWFYSPDWSTPECHAAREFEGSSRLRLLAARIDRLMSGWRWRNAIGYKP